MSKYRFKTIGVVALVIIVIFALGACDLIENNGNEFRETTYNLEVSHDGMGETTPPAGKHAYEQNTMVHLEASPYDDWEFTYWEGEVVDPYSAETKINMNDDRTVTAYFEGADDPFVEEGVEVTFITDLEGDLKDIEIIYGYESYELGDEDDLPVTVNLAPGSYTLTWIVEYGFITEHGEDTINVGAEEESQKFEIFQGSIREQ